MNLQGIKYRLSNLKQYQLSSKEFCLFVCLFEFVLQLYLYPACAYSLQFFYFLFL